MNLLFVFFTCSFLIFTNHCWFCESSRNETEMTPVTEGSVWNKGRGFPTGNQWPKKKQNGHREQKKGRHNHHSSTRRYFEKQLLVRNKTLALLGAGMERFFPNAVDLLDINPQELPGESPFQKWHNQGKTQTQESDKQSPTHLNDSILKPSKLLDLDQEKSVSDAGSDQIIEYSYKYETPHFEDNRIRNLNFEITLKTLLSIFPNSSDNNNGSNLCQKWLGCQRRLRQALTGQLPSCPCEYPSGIFYDASVWDIGMRRHFHWRDASGERLDVYKPGAEYCIRSIVGHGSASLAAQHCCYDRQRRLLTRGSGAGSPELVSPDASPRLHRAVDLLPWVVCKGDFTIYHRVRPPDNGNNCTANPPSTEFHRQIHLAKFY